MKARSLAKAAPDLAEPPIARLEARNRELTRTLQIVEEARVNLADQYDFAPIGFVTLDAKGCVREINLTAARMLGWERSRLLSLPFFPYVTKGYCPAFLHHLRECHVRNREVTTEVSLRTPAGGTVPVELRSVPVLDPRHGDTVYRTALSDITERLRAGAALRESEERYRELVELLPDAVFIVREGTIDFANSAALRLCAVESAQLLVGRELTDWVRPAFRAAVHAVLSDHAPAAHETPTIEGPWARHDGSPVDVEIAVRPFRHRGEPATLVVARDVTRRKTAERQVLVISERERSGFGRDLHDGLSQSLMGAACMAEALRNGIRQTGSADAVLVDRLATVIRECGEEARGLARGLCPVTMEKSGLVAALHELTAEVAGRTRVGCALECDDRLAIEDVSVATNLYRIAQEAVSNAIKHGRARAVSIRLAQQNGSMILCVQDDGKGFPARPKQTGMGLHTMRYRATIIGGSLEVRRSHPRGTVVTCTFPNPPVTP